MKSRTIDTITSNEDHVRMRIFDGDLPISDAAFELIRIERAQHDAERLRHSDTIKRLCCAEAKIRQLETEKPTKGYAP